MDGARHAVHRGLLEAARSRVSEGLTALAEVGHALAMSAADSPEGRASAPDSTAEILTRARRGDDAARDALFARHETRLRLFVRYRLGRVLARRVEVDDVVQETQLRAIAGLHRFDGGGEGDFFRFLRTLARHVIADIARAARSQKRSARLVRLDRSDWSRAGASEGAVASRGSGPLTRALAAEQALTLELAYEALPSDYRRVIALRQFEGRPAREVGAALGSTEGAVHALYRRALLAWAREAQARGLSPDA